MINNTFSLSSSLSFFLAPILQFYNNIADTTIQLIIIIHTFA